MPNITNKEWIDNNNLKIDDLITQATELPDYQDIEPIYDVTDITTNQIPYTAGNQDALAYVKNYFSCNKIGSSSSSSYHYLGRINQDGTVTIFKSINGAGLIILVDVIDNYIYYTSTSGSGSFINNFVIYRINMDDPLYTQENYMTVSGLHSAAWSADIRFYGPSIIGLGNETYIQLDLKNKTYSIRNDGICTYPMSISVGLDNNRKRIQTMSNGVKSVTDYSDVIRFVNIDASKAIVGNDLYTINNNLSQGSMIKQNVLSNLNLTLNNYIITHFDGNYYYLLPNTSSAPSSSPTGYLVSFNEADNEFTIIFTLNKLTLSISRYYSLTPYFISNNNYMQYLTCEADIDKLIGYNVYGNRLYFNRPEDIQSDRVINNYQVYEKDGTAIIGTMPNNGTLNYTPSTSQQTIPAGYTSGGTISAVSMTEQDIQEAEDIISDLFGEGENE